MKLTLKRYTFLLSFQFAFLIADLFFNSFAQWWTHKNLKLTILFFIIQDILTIGEYLLFTLSLHSTCVYQVGASHIILQKCKFFLCIMITYFLLSISQHFWIVYNMIWALPGTSWPATLTVLCIIQRLVSFVYYYTYKRTALLVADPRYEEANIDWIASQLSEM